MIYKATSNTKTTLAATLGGAGTDVTLVLANQTTFPTISSGTEWTALILRDAAGNHEWVIATARTTGNVNVTIVRGVLPNTIAADGTYTVSAGLIRAWSIGDIVELAPVGNLFAEAVEDIKLKQDVDPTLTALSNVATAANKLIYATDTDAFTTTDFTAAARALLDDEDAAAMRVTLSAAGTGPNTFTGLQKFAAGADIASATTIDLTSASGNSPRITGTTATSAVTMSTGQQIRVVADGAWPLTYHATTNRINTSGANVTLAANDIVDYHKDLSGVVHGQITKKDGTAVVVNPGKLVQTVHVQTGAVDTTTSVIPVGDSIPQNTDGGEFMTLAITPTSSSNYLEIDVVLNASNAYAGYTMIAALFQDSTAGALAAGTAVSHAARGSNIVFRHRMLAGTTSETIFKVRAGPSDATTMTFNGISGSRILGGVMASSITIREVMA